MPRIHVLSPHIANQIAAGEVVERPASVVKELVENAVDAGATAITIELQNGGTDVIRVTDNGCGIPAADCKTAFLRHATSKIQQADDLSHIESLGFRGEALASIAAVSTVTMQTHTKDEELGVRICVEGGQVLSETPVGCTSGTDVEVRGLFYNVPARLKFLKSARTEAGYVGDYVSRMMMALPHIAFQYIHNGKTVYRTFGDGDLKSAVFAIYGQDVLPHLCDVLFDDGYVRISGLIGTAEVSRQNRQQQSFFLNGRYIRSFALSSAVQLAYDTRLMIGRFPFAVLSITIASGEVDVNVHPTKMEVRFVDEARVCRTLTRVCAEALIANSAPPVAAAPMHFSEQTPAVDMPPSIVYFAEKPASISGPELRLPERRDGYAVQERLHTARPAGSVSSGIPKFSITAQAPRVETVREPKPEQVRMFDAPCALIGVLFDTYWILQQGDDIFFVDQHAAHERRIYERLMAEDRQTVSQKLLIPKTVRLQPLEYDAYQSSADQLASLGFQLEDNGDQTVLLTAVPQLDGTALDERFLHDALAEIAATGTTSSKSLRRDALIQSACKHAIKAGEPIAKEELLHLLDEYRASGTPLTCPHGRPVMVRMTKLELEKLFKRVL